MAFFSVLAMLSRPVSRAMASVSGATYEPSEIEERMRSVVNHVVDGIISIDERGTVTTFNPAAERIFGYVADAEVGFNHHLTKAVDPNALQAFVASSISIE
jgi:PAS domain-containing protein